MLLPDRFHREAMDNGHVSEQSLASLGRAAIFCINGQVRPEMAALQRARRSGTDREALGREAQTVLCPAGCGGGDVAVYGSGPFALESSVCVDLNHLTRPSYA